MKFLQKNKKTIFIILGIIAVISMVLIYLNARKNHIATLYWIDQIKKLKSYLTVNGLDDYSFNNVPESLSYMVDWANDNYVNLREPNETIDLWLDRQITHALNKEGYLAKLLF